MSKDKRFTIYVNGDREAYYDNVEQKEVEREVVERHFCTKYAEEISEKERVVEILWKEIEKYNETCAKGFEITGQDINKQEQKQRLIDIINSDEELGLY